MKKMMIFLVLFSFAISLTACNKGKYNVEENTLYISKDNEIIEVAFEALTDYDSITDYSEYLDTKISDYNFKVGSIVIYNEELEEAGDKGMRTKMHYANYYTYAGYRDTNFVSAKISEAKVFKDNDYSANYIRVSDGNGATTEEVLSHDDYYIIYIQQDVNIYIDGTIMYYSDNVEILEENLIKANSEEYCCIVFK